MVGSKGQQRVVKMGKELVGAKSYHQNCEMNSKIMKNGKNFGEKVEKTN